MTVSFDLKNNTGFITLDRERALNALNLEMTSAIYDQLLSWKGDDAVKQIIVNGAGEKSFCAGGDVKAIYLEKQELGDQSTLAQDFFFHEYRLNLLIATYPKPYISLASGIVMGGGVGLSVHGSHRVVTETTMFAMPETAIGLFPDVGGGYFLSRAPGKTGLFAAIAGYRLYAADCFAIGYATDYIKSENLQKFQDHIVETNDVDGAFNAYGDVSYRDGYNDEGAELVTYRDQIDSMFTGDTAKDIMKNVHASDTVFGKKIAELLSHMSPLSMMVTCEQVKRSASMTLEEVLVMEYRLSQYCTAEGDFDEGIRALLVDKDKSPKWIYTDIHDVPNDVIEKAFNYQPPKGDLTFS